MPEKARKAQGEVKKSLNIKLLTVSTVLAAAIITSSILYQFFWRPSRESEVKFSLKAAIIDQLGEDFFNQTFISAVTTLLERYNFTVEYHGYNQANVEFFRRFAKSNYGVIILRTHVALRKDGSVVDFFTSERYVSTKHRELQDKGLLVKGELNVSGTVKEFFAFTPDFVRELEGTFPQSIVIAMGCHSLNRTSGQPMAKAFCDKGAKVYIGWSSLVSASHSDREITKLIKRLLDGNETIKEAVKKASPEFMWGTRSELMFYPPAVENLRVPDLIRGVTYQTSP
ncbi:MAG: hypothetical protein RMJ03_02760 [Nitrososphaerota archaeon]|nr:hypothetical protein [Nitrososphaerota archaeon]